VTFPSNRPGKAGLSRRKRRWPVGYLSFVAVSLAASSAMASERVSLHFGEVSALRGDEGTFSVLLNAKPITDVFATEVSLYRVAPQGHTEYVVVELWHPALHCHHSYVVLALDSKGRLEKSNVFGQCRELRGVSHVHGGVQVDLRRTARPGTSKTAVDRYLVSSGRVTRLRAPASVERR
jgi:hypothetical protein